MNPFPALAASMDPQTWRKVSGLLAEMLDPERGGGAMSKSEDPGSDTGGMAEQQASALLGGDVREGYADIGDMRLHYVEAGEGPLIVLLHGFPEFW
jgi:hypothetical protein